MKKSRLLLDTCAWLWVASDHSRIQDSVGQYLEQHDWAVAAISVWEVAMLVQKKKIELSMPLRQWIKQALVEVPYIKLLSLSLDIALKSCELNIPYGDPADRLIIATAEHEKLELVTADKKMITCARELGISVLAL